MNLPKIPLFYARELCDLFRRDEEIENVKYRFTFDLIFGAGVIVF